MSGSFLDQVRASLPELAGGFRSDPSGREAAIGQLDELLEDLRHEPDLFWIEQGLLDLLLEWPHTRRAFLRFLPAASRSRNEPGNRSALPSLQELFDAISAVKNVLVRDRPVSFDDQVVAWLQPEPTGTDNSQQSKS